MRIEAEKPQSLKEFFGKNFVIPEFQRPYSWDDEHCKQLWDDIQSFLANATEPGEQFYLGTVVAYREHATSDTLYVVDGQQRLTTLTILARELFLVAKDVTDLEGFIYAQPSGKRELDKSKPRLQTRVRPGVGRSDEANFKMALGMLKQTSGDDAFAASRFSKNRACLRERVKAWGKGMGGINDINAAATKFTTAVTLLPLTCDSKRDALDLFQLINDRGLHLGDTDIFKAKIYGALDGDAAAQNDFIERWGALWWDEPRWAGKKSKENFLFTALMNILKARDRFTSDGLKKYIVNCLNREKLVDGGLEENRWSGIMRSLEVQNWAWHEAESVCGEGTVEAHYDRIYRAILRAYSNDHWQFPLCVFYDKHVEGDHVNGFTLPGDKQEAYRNLLRDTVRFFFLRAVLGAGGRESVKRVAQRACKHILDGEPGDPYGDTDKIAPKALKNELVKGDKPGGMSNSLRGGLAWVYALLECSDKTDLLCAFSDALKKDCEIEHIHPCKKWKRSWTQWTKTDHDEYVWSIGNLVPLEMRLNRGVGNAAFQYKAENAYSESDIPAVKKLAARKGKRARDWLPHDVKERRDKAISTLAKFLLSND